MEYFNPSFEILTVVCCFIAVDLVTGIWASMVRDVKITSAGLRRGVAKAICYFLFILLAHAARESLSMDWDIVKFAGGYLMATEGISVLENMSIITGNNVFIEILSVVKSWKKKVLKEKVDEYQDKFKSDKEE